MEELEPAIVSEDYYLLLPLCSVCRHLIEWQPIPRCRAFPAGIPAAICLTREHDHREPFPGDGGVLFEPDPVQDPDDVARIVELFELRNDPPSLFDA